MDKADVTKLKKLLISMEVARNREVTAQARYFHHVGTVTGTAAHARMEHYRVRFDDAWKQAYDLVTKG